MSMTGLSQIDHAVQQLHVWLGELMMMLDWNDRQRAYRALHTVLPLLRARLPVQEAAHLSAQLPLLVRGLFLEGWHPAKEPVKDRDGEQFEHAVASAFACTSGAHAEEIVTAVLTLLVRHVSTGEMAQVKGALPEGIRRFWPSGPSEKAPHAPGPAQ